MVCALVMVACLMGCVFCDLWLFIAVGLFGVYGLGFVVWCLLVLCLRLLDYRLWYVLGVVDCWFCRFV